ncbi:hypothetical protein NL676_003583 [Syzygium grande]|nr:hypothetical protein NL676_003583 [Syzygium grande]
MATADHVGPTRSNDCHPWGSTELGSEVFPEGSGCVHPEDSFSRSFWFYGGMIKKRNIIWIPFPDGNDLLLLSGAQRTMDPGSEPQIEEERGGGETWERVHDGWGRHGIGLPIKV